MARGQRTGRVVARRRKDGSGVRYYGDFRDYAKEGGKREALVIPGDTRATADRDVAEKLASDRLVALELKRKDRGLGTDRPSVALADFADEHLECKRKEGTSTSHVATCQVYLERAVAFFDPEGEGRPLESIDVQDVEAWRDALTVTQYRGRPIRPATALQHLLALSNLFKRAMKRKLVPLGHNPVWALEQKPAVRALEASWLEVPDAALLLEAARLYHPAGGNTLPYVYPLVATFLLSGGRKDEVLGLRGEDVSFERGQIHFQATPFRRGNRGKSRHADRWVPLFPQLRAILGEYVATRPPTTLLFPAWDGAAERRLGDLRKTLGAVCRLVGLDPKQVTTKTFRHTFASAAVQLVDHGSPISLDTVRRWLGHGDEKLIRHIYGHLATVRHRAEVVEFRVDQHESIGDRLARLRASTDRPDPAEKRRQDRRPTTPAIGSEA